MPAGRPPIVDALRDATAVHHRAVEEAADALGDGLEGYVQFLELQYGFYAGLEPALARAPGLAALGLDLEPRRRAHLFAADLLHLGRHPGALPRCRDLPRVDTTPRALGAAYVLEGSTLGGIFILAQLRRSLGVAPGAGASGVAPYGAGLRDMWVAFTDVLDRHVRANPGDEEPMVHGAQETYAKLLAWMRSNRDRDRRPANG